MRTGRPKKYKKAVTISISLEDKQVQEIDSLRGGYSRGEYLNILIISDNLKTKKILDLKSENEELSSKLESITKNDNSNLQSFQKSIHSNFIKYYKEYLDKMPIHTKKFWADQLKCRTIDLINYI